MTNLYLIGMMGSGKSVTAKRLAQLLNYQFVDLDSVIEKKNGMSVNDIFARAGESTFRGEEAIALEETAAQKECVVSTGGGIILREANVQRMRATGLVIYLEASPEVLWERVKGKTHRPLLAGEKPKEKLFEILEARKKLYEESASLKVLTDGKSPEAVAEQIFETLRQKA